MVKIMFDILNMISEIRIKIAKSNKTYKKNCVQYKKRLFDILNKQKKIVYICESVMYYVQNLKHLFNISNTRRNS